MLTLLMVLSVWTGLAVLTAGGLCLVLAGARRLEEQHPPRRAAAVPAARRRPASFPVPGPRAGSDQVVPASA